MRALVTDASGFLGRRLVWQLHALGHEPVTLGPGSSRCVDGVAVASLPGSLDDPASLPGVLRRVDVVFHIATPDVDAFGAVLDASRAARVTTVVASSVSAYGPTGIEPESETYWSHADPASASEAAIRDVHLAARDAMAAGADVRIAAVGTLYGSDDPSPLGRLTRWYMTVPFPVLPLRDTRWSTVHVDDCADGLIRLAEDGRAGDEYLLVAESVSVKEFFETVAAASDKPAPLAHIAEPVVTRASRFVEWGVHAAGGPHELVADLVAASVRNHSFTAAAARRDLGWTPRPLAVGLAHVAAAYGKSPRHPA